METSQFIKRLDLRFNVYELKRDWESLRKEVDVVNNQIALNKQASDHGSNWQGLRGSLLDSSTKLSESDFCSFNEGLKDIAPYIFEVCKCVSDIYPVGRMRILVLNQDHCYPAHHDFERRWHIPIVAPEESFIYFRNSAQTLFNESIMESSHGFGFNIPDDGYLYEIAAHLNHTACNPSSNTHGGKDRVHIVFNEKINF